MLSGRVIDVLAELGRAHIVTAPSLAHRLGVTEKTIRRDVAQLISAGVPIVVRLGRNGGWFLAEPPAPGPDAMRLVTPAAQLDRLTIPGIRWSVLAAVGAGRVRVEVGGPSLSAVAWAVALLPMPVELEWPDTASAMLASVGRDVLQRYGPASDAAATPVATDRSPMRRARSVPARPVRQRIHELPTPDRRA